MSKNVQTLYCGMRGYAGWFAIKSIDAQLDTIGVGQ